jgi:hypothetical protein
MLKVRNSLLVAFVLSLAIPVAMTSQAQDMHQGKRASFTQTNLVSDGFVKAAITDPNLKNPWGIAFFQGVSPFWISDNNAGVSTLYDGAGVPFPAGNCHPSDSTTCVILSRPPHFRKTST